MRLVRVSGSKAELTNYINWGGTAETRRLSPGVPRSPAHQTVGNKANSRAQRPARAWGLAPVATHGD